MYLNYYPSHKCCPLSTINVCLTINSLDCAPLCTPPIPPVTNTGMPVVLAAIMVLDTVVAPVRPCRQVKHSYQHITNIMSLNNYVSIEGIGGTSWSFSLLTGQMVYCYQNVIEKQNDTLLMT